MMKKNRLFFTLIILNLAALFLAACGTAATATPTSVPASVSTSAPTTVVEISDPAVIAQEFYKATNAGDIEAAMALVAEDVKCRGGCYLTGKEAFRSYIQGSLNLGGQVEISDLQVEGDKVTYRWEAYNQDGNFVASGVEVLQIQDGEIILMEIRPQ